MKAQQPAAAAPAARDESSPSRLLRLDASLFKTHLGHTPFKIRHNLVNHPLLSISSLVELSKRLPTHHVKFNSGEAPIGTRLYTAPDTGMSAQETLRRIHEAKSWMVLKYVEGDPAYAELMNDCLNEVRELSEYIDPGMMRREAYIFVTSPNSFTSWHMDPEHSFLLQATGTKTMYVQSNSILGERDWELYFDQGTVPPFKEEYRASAVPYHIRPGEGLHVPVTVPHWVVNGPDVSISFSITFRTAALERRAVVYYVNSRIRRKHLRPRPYGSRRSDAAKVLAFRAVRRVKRMLGDTGVTHSGKY